MAAGEVISTGVDGFITLLKESGKIEINDAAAKLGLSRQVLEEWAQVLEEQGLIKIEYKFTKFYLVWLAAAKEDVEMKKEFVSEQAAVAKRQAEARRAELERLGVEFESMRRDFSRISDAFEIEFGGVKSRIEALQELKRQRGELLYLANDLREKYEAKISGFKDRLKDSDDAVKSYLKRQDEITARLEAESKKIATLQETGAPAVQEIKSPAAAKASKALSVSAKKAAMVMKDLSALDSEYSAVAGKISKAESLISSQKADFLEFSRDAEAKLSAIGKINAKADEKISRASEELDRSARDAVALAKSFIDRKGQLEKLTAQVNAASKDFVVIKSRLDEFESKKKEFDEINQQVGVLTKDVATMLERKADIESLISRAEAIKRDLSGMGEVMRALGEKRAEVDRLGALVESIKKDFVGLGENFDARLVALEESMKTLESLQKQREDVVRTGLRLQQELAEKSKAVSGKFKDSLTIMEGAEGEVKDLAGKVKALEPKLVEAKAVKGELDASAGTASTALTAFGNAVGLTDTLEGRIAAIEGEEAALRKDVEGFGDGLKKTASALMAVRQEFDSKASDLDKLLSASEEELKKLTGELSMGAERADDLVKGFEERIGKMKAVEAQLQSLEAQRKALSDEVFSIMKGLEAVESPKRTMPLTELTRKITESKKRLAEASEKVESQQKAQAAVKASLKDILDSE